MELQTEPTYCYAVLSARHERGWDYNKNNWKQAASTEVARGLAFASSGTTTFGWFFH